MKEFNDKCDSGEINFQKDFQIDRYLRGYSPDEYRAFTLDEHDIFWNDRTDDFDFPSDYDNFVRTKDEQRDYLSVILPLYNASKWGYNIMQQLSLQKACYPETELIAIDDGSTDGWSYLDIDGWQTIHQPNKGVSSARNTGLMASTGDYIAFVDADDQVEPDFLQEIYRQMRAADQPKVVAYAWDYVDGREGPDHGEMLPNWAVWGYSFRRDAIGNEKFKENLKVAEDIEWLKRIIKEAPRRANRKIYKYDWNMNPDSLTKRSNRGEIKNEP